MSTEEQLPDWNELSKNYPVDIMGAHWVMMVTCAQPKIRCPFLLDFNEEGFAVSSFEAGTQGKLLVVYRNPKEPSVYPDITYNDEPAFNKMDLIRLIAVFRLSLKVTL